MSWYKTGQINITNGSQTVVGVGTNFTRFVEVGEALLGPDGKHYEIATVLSATELRLVSSYTGATAANQSYAIVPVQGYVRELAHKAADLIDAHKTVPAEALSYAESAEQSAAKSATSATEAANSAAAAAVSSAQALTRANAAGVSASESEQASLAANAAKTSAQDFANAAAESASAARASKEEAAATVSVVTEARNAALAHTATAKAWADKLDGEVEPGKYSARYWAQIIGGAATGGVVYMGTLNAAGGAFPSSPSRGHLYKVSTAGEIDGVNYSVKDMIIYNGESWDKIDATDEVTSVAGKVGAVTLTNADVGLGNADNTSDANKPVSTATQAALDTKAPVSHTHDASAIVSGTIADDRLPARLREKPQGITDWNTAVASGWYQGKDAANAPSAGYFIGNVECHHERWVTQVVHLFNADSAADTKTYRRESSDASGVAAWGPWYRLRLSEAEQAAVTQAWWDSTAVPISKVAGLQAALNGTVKTTGHQAISGIKSFSDPLELRSARFFQNALSIGFELGPGAGTGNTNIQGFCVGSGKTLWFGANAGGGAMALDGSGNFTASGSITAGGGVLATSGAIGYGFGAGGAVIQGSANGKGTPVALNKLCGAIMMDSQMLAPGEVATFVFSNSTIGRNSMLFVQTEWGVGSHQYSVGASVSPSGSALISLKNETTSNRTEAVNLRFFVFNGVTS